MHLHRHYSAPLESHRFNSARPPHLSWRHATLFSEHFSKILLISASMEGVKRFPLLF